MFRTSAMNAKISSGAARTVIVCSYSLMAGLLRLALRQRGELWSVRHRSGTLR
jgi:hypothetical protein